MSRKRAIPEGSWCWQETLDSLGPVLRSPLALKHGLGYSLLERLLAYNSLYKKGPNGYDPQFITKLLRNYRYHCPLPCSSSHIVTVAVSWKGGGVSW